MFNRRETRSDNVFVELPTGIFTASGVWFHTSEASLREFALEVVELIGLEKLLDDAIVWTRSSDAVAALTFIASLEALGPVAAVLIGLLSFYFWYTFIPVLVSPMFTPVMRVLGSVAFQGLVYIVVLSLIANAGNPIASIVGLGWFLSLRWGLIAKGVVALSKKIGEAELPKPDAVLRSLIIRYAIGRKITLASTESFENRIHEIWQRGKRK